MQSSSAIKQQTQAASRAVGVATSAAVSLISIPYCLLVNLSAMQQLMETASCLPQQNGLTWKVLISCLLPQVARQSSLNRVSGCSTQPSLCTRIDLTDC